MMNAKTVSEWPKASTYLPESQRVVLSYEEDLKTPILDAARHLLKHWQVVLCLAVLGVAAGVGLSFVIPKRYTVDAQYSFTADENSGGALGGLKTRLGGIASLAGVDLGPSGASHAEIVAALRSEAFIRAFIQENNLLPILFSEKWDAAKRVWKNVDERPTLAMGHDRFTRQVLSIAEDKTTSLLRVSAKWTEAELAQAWIERLVLKLNQSLRQRAMERADQNLKFLLQEMRETQTVEISQALYGLIEAETRQKMMAKVNASYALRVVAPPVVPDADDFTTPNRALLAMLFGMLGLMIGVLYAVWRTLAAKAAYDASLPAR